MRKLYEINNDLEKLLDENATMAIDDENAVDLETGELFNLSARIEALNIERNEKIKGVAVYLDDINIKRDALAGKIAKLKKQLESLDKEIDGITTYLLIATENQGFKDDDIEVKVKSNNRCIISDESVIPEKFIKTETKIETKISKTEITKAIKAGEEVPGATLQKSYSLSII